jgi:Ca2+-binding EF-hand superfamily protein
MTRRNLLIALMGASGAVAATAVAQKPAAPKQQDKFALADEDVRQLLLLMDADKNGRISKREWMNFMEAEFNRLDKDGNGELDARELLQSKLSARQSGSVNLVR